MLNVIHHYVDLVHVATNHNLLQLRISRADSSQSSAAPMNRAESYWRRTAMLLSLLLLTVLVTQ